MNKNHFEIITLHNSRKETNFPTWNFYSFCVTLEDENVHFSSTAVSCKRAFSLKWRHNPRSIDLERERNRYIGIRIEAFNTGAMLVGCIVCVTDSLWALTKLTKLIILRYWCLKLKRTVTSSNTTLWKRFNGEYHVLDIPKIYLIF